LILESGHNRHWPTDGNWSASPNRKLSYPRCGRLQPSDVVFFRLAPIYEALQ